MKLISLHFLGGAKYSEIIEVMGSNHIIFFVYSFIKDHSAYFLNQDGITFAE
jgi:hypothetical protein